ncbi:MAG: (Fe-S)-binding protein [Methanoregulaceae archaeon]|nr:(Fe-S)-binding protein [Methanoregulaceae archaeon]
MKVQLLITCLGDALYGEVGIATARVLQAVGCEVEFPEGQTCCGQPPFNAGHWPEAQAIAAHTRRTFDPKIPIVTPSASCAAMIRHGYAQLDREPPLECYELTEFLLKHGFSGALRSPRRVAVHTGCHGRMINLGDTAERVVGSIKGVTVVVFGEPEQCCGFGGAFAATHRTVSAGIADAKLDQLVACEADEVVSTDLGCLMHLRGRAKFGERELLLRHVAELLAEAVT